MSINNIFNTFRNFYYDAPFVALLYLYLKNNYGVNYVIYEQFLRIYPYALIQLLRLQTGIFFTCLLCQKGAGLGVVRNTEVFMGSELPYSIVSAKSLLRGKEKRFNCFRQL